MMSDTARMIASDHSWTIFAVAVMLAYFLVSAALTYRVIVGGGTAQFTARLRKRAARCLDQTGFVGALLARHTVLITANVLVISLAFSLLSAIKSMDDRSTTVRTLELGLEFLAGSCILLVAITVTIIFLLCNEIVRQGEEIQ